MNRSHLPNRRSIVLGTAAALVGHAGGAQSALPRPTTEGLVARTLVFPRDHGSHNENQTEWWYLTGHAQDSTGRDFGFQVTFFRSRVDAAQALNGPLAARQLLFAHAAITDVQGQRLWHDQRIARWNGEPPVQRERGVFAETQDMQVVLRDWSMQRTPAGHYLVAVHSDDFDLKLEAAPSQAILLQGDHGFSRKGPDPGQASFYVSHPQLALRGQLRLKNHTADIAEGRAWLDHEWSDAFLHPDAVGWDWIGMNLFNGDSLTAFQLRRANGRPVWAGGSFRTAADAQRPNGTVRFAPEQVEWTAVRRWTSPQTRANYPVEWSVRTPMGRYTVKAVIDPQELDSRASTGTVYWEGLSDLIDSQGRRVGQGYLEMTGYAQRLVL